MDIVLSITDTKVRVHVSYFAIRTNKATLAFLVERQILYRLIGFLLRQKDNKIGIRERKNKNFFTIILFPTKTEMSLLPFERKIYIYIYNI